eukprot:675084-Prymnesium_polylepis.1
MSAAVRSKRLKFVGTISATSSGFLVCLERAWRMAGTTWKRGGTVAMDTTKWSSEAWCAT